MTTKARKKQLEDIDTERIPPVEGSPFPTAAKPSARPGKDAARHRREETEIDDAIEDSFPASPDPVTPGGPPASYEFEESGTWTFYCSLHSSAAPGATNWSGMVGTVSVGGPAEDVTPPTTTAAASPAPIGGVHPGPVTVALSSSDGTSVSATGVDYIEYVVDGKLPVGDDEGSGDVQRLENTGDDEPFTGEVNIASPGAHEIEYRAVDKAGNREGVKKLSVVIGSPKLKIKPKPKTVKLKSGKKNGKLKVEIRNNGNGNANNIKVCVKAPKKLLKVTGGKCKTVKSLGPKAKKNVTFKFKVKKAAAGKTAKVKIEVKASNANKAKGNAKVRVKS